jgi:glycogen debranching enzyme
MPLEITVGPPQLVIHDGQTVWATEPDGQLSLESSKGLMFFDTRMLSTWSIYANGASWLLLNAGAFTHYAARIYLTNPPITTEDGVIGEHSLSLVIGRWIDGGAHEDLDIHNHGLTAVRFQLEIAMRSDFADMFEVKSSRFVRRGRIVTDWDEAAQRLRTGYENADFSRAVAVTAKATSPAVYANGRLTFDIDLASGAAWHGCLLYDLEDGDRLYAAPLECTTDTAQSSPGRSLIAWRKDATKITTANEEFYRLYQQAVDDIVALRLPVEESGAIEIVPAAGLPWFAALFGRDSLVVSLQTACLSTEFARGSLRVLGARQARARDDYRDAEPGKILHEMRRGELAHFKLIPHTPYYGTADATPLYLMVLHSAWKWTGDHALITQHLDVAERCLSWIDDYGDRDGDGFQEYQTRSSAGYENMGWKDSGDGVLYPDGTNVRGPKALCELQGYVYAAWRGMAEIYLALGHADRAAAMTAKADALFLRFNAAFWSEEHGFYAFALDGDKQPVWSVASNPGHCLWTGLVPRDRAARVVQRLMAPDMFCGWGIRTLSGEHRAFNPYSYHNGSVWPHDNSLIALGFKRYGFAAEASTVIRAVSGAGGFFSQHQLPELYAGIAREATGFPVQYLGVNVPQAWAAGSAIAFVSVLLGLRPDAPNGKLLIDPVLPAWLPDLNVSDLALGEQRFDLRFRRVDGATVTEVLRGDPAAIVTAPCADD